MAAIAALAGEPGTYAESIAEDIPQAFTSLADLEARDATFAAALRAIDDFAARVMRIRLDDVLATDSSIGAPTRRVFAQTIVSYANAQLLLRERARDVAARGGARDADVVADQVVEAAQATLALRAAIADGVLALIHDLSAAAVPEADRRARDRTLDDVQRKRWSAARRDLEALVQDPAAVLSAPMAARLAALPEQIDEPEPQPDVTFADMIELD
jgi:hypothetical protein